MSYREKYEALISLLCNEVEAEWEEVRSNRYSIDSMEEDRQARLGELRVMAVEVYTFIYNAGSATPSDLVTRAYELKCRILSEK